MKFNLDLHGPRYYFLAALIATIIFAALMFATAAYAVELVATPSPGGLYAGSGTGKPIVPAASMADCTASALKIGKLASYTCKLPFSVAVAPTPDHSMHGPVIDPALIPPRTTATDKGPNPWDGLMLTDGPAVRPVDIDPATGLPLPSQVPTPDASGAFREPCYFSHFANDDPIVFPGQTGRSHLHVFFGTTAANAFTIAANIRSTTVSSCAGGSLNLSAYWVPAMIDTATHAPQKPVSIMTYYKSGQIEPKLIQPIPAGLRMVSGNAANIDPAGQGHMRFLCYGVNGENPGWKVSIGDAAKDLSCNQEGADFVMAVGFPQCWDGKNLDSPDHRSHLTEWVSTWDGTTATYACPSTHPVALPEISYNVHYRVPLGGVSQWRLASDAYDTALPGGLSAHGDYMMGWDVPTMQTFVARCTGGYQDCHAYLLGDGRTLY